MRVAVVIAGSVLLGFSVAVLRSRFHERKERRERARAELLAEYTDKQLWQFMSVDEWLAGQAQLPGKVLVLSAGHGQRGR